MNTESDNRVQSLLLSLGIISADSIEEFWPRVRDREGVRVMRCRKSGVIFLSSARNIDPSYYASKEDYSYWSAATRTQALIESLEDDRRRALQFELVICNKKWLDFGTGAGGILELLKTQAAEVCAVEPQAGARNELVRLGYRVYQKIQQVPDNDFEVVTLFHTFEHLPEPIEALRSISSKMAVGGKLIVEVPHAQDFLISFLNLEAFKQFTLWSEHLILHTRQSLEIFLKEAGFQNICIEGFQRYPLANHLHWLAKGKPGGHKHWRHLQTEDLNRAYASMLARLDKCDTLIAVAQK